MEKLIRSTGKHGLFVVLGAAITLLSVLAGIVLGSNMRFKLNRAVLNAFNALDILFAAFRTVNYDSFTEQRGLYRSNGTPFCNQPQNGNPISIGPELLQDAVKLLVSQATAVLRSILAQRR